MFKLALNLGMTVGELERRMTSRELSEWIAYDNVDPFGEVRDDLRTGIECATLAQINGTKNAKPKDFMPDFRPREQQTVSDMKARFERAFKGKQHGH